VRTVLVVSKPFAPPWRDSSKNLARELVRSSTGFRYRVLAPRGTRPPADNVSVDPVYGAGDRFEPGLLQNARVLARLLLPAFADIYHFFFAPNPRTARAVQLALGLSVRRHPSVQTLCSLPAETTRIRPGCFADAVVVLSRYAEERVRVEGLGHVVRIPPCVRGSRSASPARRTRIRRQLGLGDGPLVLFAGDVEPQRGSDVLVKAAPRIMQALPGAEIVVAARAKTERSRAHHTALETQARRLGVADRIHFMGETGSIHDLLTCADAQVLAAASLEKKMDYPLVLLEGLARGLPMVVTDRPPLSELLEEGRDGAGLGVPPGDPDAVAEAVVRLCGDAEAHSRARAAARAAARDFAPEVMATAYEKLYVDLCGQR